MSSTCGSPLRRSEPSWRQRLDTRQRLTSPGPQRAEQLAAANIARLARSLDCDSYEQLHDVSIDAPDRFWRAVVADLNIPLARSWDAVLDDSQGIEWTTWFQGARLNVADACVHRWARELPDSEAAVWVPEQGARESLTWAELSREVRAARGSASRAGSPGGRHRRDVPADGTGGSNRVARLCPHRRDPGAHLLRIRRPCGLVASHRCRRQGRPHCGCVVSAREARRDEGCARRGAHGMRRASSVSSSGVARGWIAG